VVCSLGLGLDEKANAPSFKPAIKDGMPVNAYVEVEMNFSLL
jgi:hypothetical protein